LSGEAALYARRVKRAAQLLLFQRHRRPGVKGWELKRSLGRDYLKVLELLGEELDRLGLKVKVVYEEGGSSQTPPTEEDLERARFYVTLADPLTATDIATAGWRIDDLAALAVSLAFITSRQGRAPRREVEELLKRKLPGWRVEANLDRFIRRGYLGEDDKGNLYIDWRTRAEVDQKALVGLILGEGLPTQTTPEGRAD